MANNRTKLSQLKKIIKEEIKNINGLVCESGFSRLANILRGGKMINVETIGIITAENPEGPDGQTIHFSPEENNKRNNELRDFLRSNAYSYNQIKGKFGEWENPYLVRNITKERLIKIGNDWQQKAVIWGENTDDGMHFEYIEHGNTINERDIYVQTGKQGATDMFSQYKGRKFVIPFFDEKYEDAKWVGGSIGGIRECDLRENADAYDLITEIKQRCRDAVKLTQIEKLRLADRGILGALEREAKGLLSGKIKEGRRTKIERQNSKKRIQYKSLNQLKLNENYWINYNQNCVGGYYIGPAKFIKKELKEGFKGYQYGKVIRKDLDRLVGHFEGQNKKIYSVEDSDLKAKRVKVLSS